MKKKQNNKQLQTSQKIIIFLGVVIVMWLTLLTAFVADLYNAHVWQVEHQGEVIYKLMVENGKQQMEIDDLQDK